MSTIKRTVELTTDSSGACSRTEVFNPPGPFPITIQQLTARLLLPEATTIFGLLDCDAADGSPQNPAKSFQFITGEKISLGQWKLDGGDNVLMVSGRTSPARPDTLVRIELGATI